MTDADQPSITCQTIWFPKEGNSRDEYEDAFAFSRTKSLPFRAAVADGATESYYARLWAELLTRSFADAGRPADKLHECQEVWSEMMEQREASDTPWYASQKASEGAFATFLGIEWQEDLSWRAQAVGDCCLFYRGAEGEHWSWPLTSPQEFTNRPALLPSRPLKSTPPFRAKHGTAAPGDVFALATDAVAQWLIDGGWEELAGVPEAWEERVKSASADGRMRNDDCTLLTVEMAS